MLNFYRKNWIICQAIKLVVSIIIIEKADIYVCKCVHCGQTCWLLFWWGSRMSTFLFILFEIPFGVADFIDVCRCSRWIWVSLKRVHAGKYAYLRDWYRYLPMGITSNLKVVDICNWCFVFDWNLFVIDLWNDLAYVAFGLNKTQKILQNLFTHFECNH